MFHTVDMSISQQKPAAFQKGKTASQSHGAFLKGMEQDKKKARSQWS